jgi:hypothetical protein
MYSFFKKIMTATVVAFALLSASTFESAQAQTGPIQGSATLQGGGFTGPIQVAGPNGTWLQEADKVHLVLTGYTVSSSQDIGQDCRADISAVQMMFSQAFLGDWGDRLVVHPLYGPAGDAAKIYSYLETMRVGANDVVIFFHAGHGIILDGNQPVQTHMLMVNNRDSLNRGQVIKMLQAMKCRGIVLLTD